MNSSINSNSTKMHDFEALKAVSIGLNRFAAEFYKNISDGPAMNLICSPLSASTMLSMAAHGAAGDTQVEMRKALHLPDDHAMGLRGFQSLIDFLNTVQNVELSIANKIFTAVKVKQEFKDISSKFFKSEAQYLNFEDTNSASGIINTWCAEKTRDLIKNLITPGDITGCTMVLVNAVYFKGIWRNKFDERSTQNSDFYVDEKTVIHVPTMNQRNIFNYGTLAELDAVFVELPYQNNLRCESTTMFIIRPNQINGLKKVQDNIEKIDFKQLHNQKKLTDIVLSLPKFKVESHMELNPILIKMGINRMFGDANFTGISDDKLLALGCKVIQKAFIEVNEGGSVAAAATTMILMGCARRSVVIEPLELPIDRPFIYAIYHGPTDSILFQGHIKRLPA